MATLGEQLVAKAKTAIGRPYVWGAEGPSGFDCSGLVVWAAQALGIKGLPRTSQAMRSAGQVIPLAQIGVGDLVTFTYADRRGSNPGPGNHVAIYAGGGQVVQASGSKVNVGPLDTKHIDRVIRLKGSGAVPAGDAGGGAVSSAVTSVRRVFTAQHAGYDVEPKVGPYGAPTNPFKLPGWIASAGSEAASTPGGVVQASSGGDVFGGGSMPWDGVGTVLLASLFVVGGLVLVVVGGHVAIRPAPEV
ncbi:C40 family peptidase [Streptomyces sp. NPDC090109]|uniref:C40 family peptidase n=1 Tax=Streptomyces sp. NPDC090109 TaxID=3365948 RepID=UPI0037FD8F22